MESKVTGSGVVLTANGIAPVLGSGASKSIQQTAFAVKASPPAKQPVGQYLLFALLGSPLLAILVCLGTILILAMVGASSGGPTDGLSEIVFVGTWLLLSALGVAGIVVGCRFNRDEWPSLYAAWETRWLCHHCGELCEPSDDRADA